MWRFAEDMSLQKHCTLLTRYEKVDEIFRYGSTDGPRFVLLVDEIYRLDSQN